MDPDGISGKRRGGVGAWLALALIWLGMPVGWAADKNVAGAWLSPSADNWPLIPIHAALTPDGRVLTFGTNGAGQQTGFFIYDVWDPETGLGGGHVTLDNLTLTDLFCSSQVIMPQTGNIFIAGGDNWTGSATTNTGNPNTNIYKYSDDTLRRGDNMYRPRWYASTTALPNGEVYIQGGKGGEDRPEVRTTGGTFRLLTNVNTSGLNYWYPRNFLAPDGRIFGFDANGVMYFVDPSGSGVMQTVGQLVSSYVGKTSAAAMFAHGRILQFGGNANSAVVIDIRGQAPVVTASQSMSTKRQWVSATILADGRVLATGGSRVANELTDVNNKAEIWTPATGKWTLGASGLRPRLYHSGALLLPDASVLVHGGGAPGPVTNRHAEIYYPPYLYDSTGEFAQRPVISNPPSTIQLGVDFSITTDTDKIQRVTLVKSGSVTHSVNMDQRFVELQFTQSSTTSFVDAPTAVTQAPPGYYYLFAINDRGVPSKASIVRLVTASAPSDQTPMVGGTGGDSFNLSCNASEALVGVYGLADTTSVKRIGLRCVPVDSAGRWVGNPVDRAAIGGSTGASYRPLCPRDHAISGFNARVSSAINALRFECRALSPSGQLSGSGQLLSWIGATQGSATGKMRCPSNYPVYALAGRASGQLDALGAQCRRVP